MIDEEVPPLRPRVEQLGEKVAALAIIGLVAAGIYLSLTTQHPLDVSYMAKAWPLLASAAVLTLSMTSIAYLLGMGIGFFLGWARTSRSRVARAVATGWIESFRGTPMLVQLFILVALFSYYNPGRLPVQSRLIVTGVLCLLLNTSAYQGEIFRGGLQSVAAGQVEAARAIGLSRWGSMRNVVLPQAIRLVVPPLMNEFVALLKASSLLALSGVYELTYYAKLQTGMGAPITEVFVIVTLLYLLMTVPVAKVVGWFERRFRIPGLGMQPGAGGGGGAGRARGSKTTAARMIGADLAGLRALAGRRSIHLHGGAEPS